MRQKQPGGLVFVLLMALTACTPKEKQAGPEQPSRQKPAEPVQVTPVAKAPQPPLKPLSMLPGATPFDPKLTQRLENERKNSSESTWHHTRNKNPDGSPKFVNRLILETSPYLQQHSFNPINWQAWSQEAIDEAKLRDVPILLSVGYTTCHWCHVMEREYNLKPPLPFRLPWQAPILQPAFANTASTSISKRTCGKGFLDC